MGMISEVANALRARIRNDLGITSAIPENRPGLKFNKDWLPYAVISVGVAGPVSSGIGASKDDSVVLPLTVVLIKPLNPPAATLARDDLEALWLSMNQEELWLHANVYSMELEALGPSEELDQWLENSSGAVDCCLLSFIAIVELKS